MRMDTPCNLYAPAGTTPMTIADAILRECDTETLAEVLYYIDCYLKFYDKTIKVIDLKSEDDYKKSAELFRKRFQEAMRKENMFSINSRDFNDNFFDAEESEDKE